MFSFVREERVRVRVRVRESVCMYVVELCVRFVLLLKKKKKKMMMMMMKNRNTCGLI